MIEYMQRTRDYYASLGYPTYRWAQHPADLFTRLAQPLAQSKLALITTAAPVQPNAGDQGPGAAYNGAAKFFEVYQRPISPVPDLRISHIAYDRAQCAADDANTWLPIAALVDAVTDKLVGELAPELIGVPTNRSQRITEAQDAPAAFNACVEQEVQAALLVPT